MPVRLPAPLLERVEHVDGLGELGHVQHAMREEYDFSKAVRGVTATRYAQGSNVVLLDPDVAEIFPNARAVNEALRTFARLTKPVSRSRSRKRTA